MAPKCLVKSTTRIAGVGEPASPTALSIMTEEIALDDHRQPVHDCGVAFLAGLLRRQAGIADMAVRRVFPIAACAVVDRATGLDVLWPLDLAHVLRGHVVGTAALGVHQLGVRHQQARSFAFPTVTLAFRRGLDGVVDFAERR